MDAVITYVNMADPRWQEDYERTVGKKMQQKRFRDWGTLKYLLRGIEKNMSFIRNVFLVVSRESQVPAWVNRENIHVVLHRDIIPEQYLPVFNSTAIEMFLHRIPGLDERFIYFNDDLFPVMPCEETDFFQGDSITTGFSHHLLAINLYKAQTRNANDLACKVVGRKPSRIFVRPQHTCTPMFRSNNEHVSAVLASEIAASITPLRSLRNINQYLFTDVLYYSGRTVPRSRISNKHFSVAASSPETVAEYIGRPDRKIVGINDAVLSDERFRVYRTILDTALRKRFSKPSRFER